MEERGARIRDWCFAHRPVAIGVTAVLVLSTVGLGIAVALNGAESHAKSEAAGRDESRRALTAQGLTAQELSARPTQGVDTGAPAPDLQIPEAGFRIDCPSARAIPPQSGDAFACEVASVGGFSQPVSLRCANLPAGLDCRPDPPTVTPPADGTVQFHLGLSNNSVEAGDHSFQVVGTSGRTTARFTFPFDLGGGLSVEDAAGSSAFVHCFPIPPDSTVAPGQTRSTECEFTASPLFRGDVVASCDAPPGITCSIAPAVVAPREAHPVRVTLTVAAAPDAPSGTARIDVKGRSDAFDGKLRPPSTFLEFFVPQPTPAVPQHVGPAYTVPPCSFAGGEISLAPGGVTIFVCMVQSYALDGELTLVVDGQGPGTPQLIPGPATIELAPGEHAPIGASINAADAAPGVYEFTVTIKPSAIEHYTPDHPSQRMALRVIVEESSP